MSPPAFTLLALVAFIGTGVAVALGQPEYRPLASDASASVDPCARFGLGQERTASTPPGFDPRLPVPRGATSFTGVGGPGREASMAAPAPAPPGVLAPTDPAYQECLRQR